MDERELMIQTYSNMAGRRITITHIPTGLVASSSFQKSWRQAEHEAMDELEAKYDGWLHAQEAPDA